MAPGRAKGLEENGAGPSGGGGGERGIFKHRGQGQARWAFRAWGSGGDGIYRAHTQRAVRERGRRTCPPGNDRSNIRARLTAPFYRPESIILLILPIMPLSNSPKNSLLCFLHLPVMLLLIIQCSPQRVKASGSATLYQRFTNCALRVQLRALRLSLIL